MVNLIGLPKLSYRSALLSGGVALAFVVNVSGWFARLCQLSYVAYAVCLIAQNRSLPGEPPVIWSWVPWLGSAGPFGKAPLGFLRASRAACGSSCFVAVVAGRRLCFVCDATVWSKVFKEPESVLGFTPVAMEVVIGAFGVAKEDAAIAFTGQVHVDTKSQFLKLSSKEDLASLTRDVARALQRHLLKLEGEFPLFETAAPPIFFATMEALIGPGFATPELYDAFRTFDSKFAYLAGGAPFFLFQGAAKALEKIAGAFKTSKQYSEGKAASRLMRDRRKLSSHLSAESQGHIQSSMIWAATANTTPAALWTLHWIAKNKGARDAVRVEVDKIGAFSPLEMTDDAIESLFATEMPVLESCISETLRLTSQSLVLREVLQPYTLARKKLRQGDRIALFPQLLHYDEALTAPWAFDHERYLSGDVPLMPFGGGRTMCPGRKVARREILAFLLGILTRFEVHIDEDAAVPPFDPTRLGLGVPPPAAGADVLITFEKIPPRA